MGSFVYRSRRPLHPERLARWFEEWPEEVVRAKGWLWIASRAGGTMAGLAARRGEGADSCGRARAAAELG
ncbi:GTP-binding protein [Paenibacillus soyae]|uniref:GTP-binding protein n=1 Tax=Paenibacillus soyae TaxID=2969249 RepID=UPI0035301DE9